MKKYIPIFIILLALCGNAWGEKPYWHDDNLAGETLECTQDKCPGTFELAMSPVFLGASGGAAGCSQTIIRQFDGAGELQWGQVASAYMGVNYTTTVSVPIKSISIPLYAEGSTAGTITAYICTDDSTNPNVCTAIGTLLDSSTLKAANSGYGVVYHTAYNATGVTQDGSSSYWVAMGDGTPDNSNTQRWIGQNTGSHTYKVDADGSGAWTLSDSSSECVYQLGTCEYGTGETPVQGGGNLSSVAYAIGNSTRYKLGIGMKALSAYTPVKVSVNITKYLSPTGNLTVEVYESGGNVPTGSNICSGSTSYSPAQISTSAAWYDFTLTGCPQLVADTEYFFVISSDALGDAANYYGVGNSTTLGLGLDLVGYTTSWTNFSTNAGMATVIYK